MKTMLPLARTPLAIACLLAIGFSAAAQDGPASDQPPRSKQLDLQAPVSLKPLDLSRAPTTEELMAAGQLGGLLFPTHEPANKQKAEAANLAFGQAIEEWNKHEYPKGVALFRKYLEEYPDSPWAAEAALHIGCDATYNGRYSEAEAIFNKLIGDHQGKDQLGPKMLLNKARQRLALLKVEQNNLLEANEMFSALLQDSPDWRHRTYASHWIQRLSRYAAAKQALLNCGAQALAYALEKEGRPAAASQVRTNVPSTMRGHTLSDLVKLAAAHGYELAAIQADLSDLPRLPLPAILHIGAKNPGDTSHFWVLDKVQGDFLELFDPQSQRRFRQTASDLAREWSGRVLVLSKDGALPGRQLEIREMEDSSGGCCGVPRAEDNQGDPCGRKGATKPGRWRCSATRCGRGAPEWKVNMVNLNLYVTDTPMWYEPAIGPLVDISLSYNSQSAIAQNEPFGNKWQFNYASYLVVDSAGTVLIFMPDGRRDSFSPDGAGGYIEPYRVYNTLTRLGPNHYALRSPDDTVYEYRVPAGISSQQPFLTEIRDAYGQKLSFGYDANVHLTTITDAQGRVTTLSYNASGLVTSVADPFGRNARFEYDARHNLTRMTDMGGYWSTLAYDSSSYLTNISDARGTYGFYIEPADGIDKYPDDYPPPGDSMYANYRITITDRLGRKEEFFYYGGCDIDHYAACDGYSWYVSPRDYIPWQSQEINNYQSRAPKTRYFVNKLNGGLEGEISKILYPAGDYIQYDYDLNTGDRTKITDAHGHATVCSYNALGRITSLVDPNGTRTVFTYANNGVDLLTISNALGRTIMTYDSHHDTLSMTDRMSNTTRFARNTYGQVVSATDPLGVTNQFLYDADARLSELRRSGQTLHKFTYDAVGRLRSHTDATGFVATNDFSLLNQLTRITYTDGKSDTFAYSTCCPGVLDSITDRGGRTFAFTHDALQRLIQIQGPDGTVTKMAYDANGNQTQLVDANNNTTTFTYDLDDRLVRKTYADGTWVSVTYDQAGFVTNRTSARGIIAAYSYDANDNLRGISYSDGTPSVAITYDAFGRALSVRNTAGTNAYSYDANWQLLVCDGPWASDSITNRYDALGQRTNLLVQGGQPIAYAYDTLNRLNSLRVGTATYAYGYLGPSPVPQSLTRPNGSITAYTRDPLERLTSILNRQQAGAVINSFKYTYDAQDQRDSVTVSNHISAAFSQSQTVQYSYNQLDQVLNARPQNRVFAYDADGNLTRGYTPEGYVFSAEYDAENRLRSLVFTNGAGTRCRNDYRYNPNGFLAQVAEYQAETLSKTTRYVFYRGLALQERDGNGSLVREFVWGLGAAGGIGGLLQLKQGGQSYDYLFDGGGNVVNVLDSTQAPAVSYAYDPFGRLLSRSGLLDQPYMFSTKPYDTRVGLCYFGYRFYSPALGRWLSRDPLGETGGINPYAFAMNNPISGTDAWGLFGGEDWGESYAEDAVKFYAKIIADPRTSWWEPKVIGAAIGGVLASLWLCENSEFTVEVLTTAAGVSAGIRGFRAARLERARLWRQWHLGPPTDVGGITRVDYTLAERFADRTAVQNIGRTGTLPDISLPRIEWEGTVVQDIGGAPTLPNIKLP